MPPDAGGATVLVAVSVELALTAPALVEDGDPARLIGLILTQGSAAVGFRVAVVGLVIMTRRSPTPVGSAPPGPAPATATYLTRTPGQG